jgi:hypothetical protein
MKGSQAAQTNYFGIQNCLENDEPGGIEVTLTNDFGDLNRIRTLVQSG